MRIGYTNYYTTKKRLMVRNTSGRNMHMEEFNGYALSVYGKQEGQIWALVDTMKQQGIQSQYKNYIGPEDTPLPHILIINPESVKRLEELFMEQGIELTPNRFDRITDWEDVLYSEEVKHRNKIQKMNAALLNKADYIKQKLNKKVNKLWQKIRQDRMK